MTEIDRIFDVAMGVSEVANLADKTLRKQQQIKDVNSKTCGNCELWMKNSCIRESQFGEIKSISSYACKDFTLDKSYQ